MTETSGAGAGIWQPPERPEWLARFLQETKSWDGRAVAPLQFDELVETAKRGAGLDDFGEDDWQEPLQILLNAIETEAELHFFGRIWTRSDILMFLEARLRIEAAYKQHPEIDEEVIDSPVFVTGLGSVRISVCGRA